MIESSPALNSTCVKQRVGADLSFLRTITIPSRHRCSVPSPVVYSSFERFRLHRIIIHRTKRNRTKKKQVNLLKKKERNRRCQVSRYNCMKSGRRTTDVRFIHRSSIVPDTSIRRRIFGSQVRVFAMPVNYADGKYIGLLFLYNTSVSVSVR